MEEYQGRFHPIAAIVYTTYNSRPRVKESSDQLSPMPLDRFPHRAVWSGYACEYRPLCKGMIAADTTVEPKVLRVNCTSPRVRGGRCAHRVTGVARGSWNLEKRSEGNSDGASLTRVLGV